MLPCARGDPHRGSGDHVLVFLLHYMAVRCYIELHQALRAKHSLNIGFGSEVLDGVTSGASRETSKKMEATPHLHRV